MNLRGLLALANVAMLLAATYSILSDQRTEAASIERQIRSLPGVTDTDHGYLSSFGERHTFVLEVQLSSDVTEQQAASVCRTVIDRMSRDGLDGHDARLHLRYPAQPHPNPHVPDFSQAEFWFNPDVHEFPPDPYQVADSIGLWLRAARSPVTAHVSLVQAWNSTTRVRFVDLTLRTDADDANTEVLANDIGDRADVTWRLARAADGAHRPHEYKANPLPPTESAMETFFEISGLVDAADNLNVYTRAFHPKYADTSVMIQITDGPGREERTLKTAEAVAKVLPRFGPEVTLTISGHESVAIVAGGCYFREGQTSNSDLERRLSEMYETC